MKEASEMKYGDQVEGLWTHLYTLLITGPLYEENEHF